ncbi:hypothetical protein EBB07_29220 [Paenibacillaceae bacterium]|nr:hypothetical protein EBB07_29220 [Paenibacillaceae bacterium]
MILLKEITALIDADFELTNAMNLHYFQVKVNAGNVRMKMIGRERRTVAHVKNISVKDIWKASPKKLIQNKFKALLIHLQSLSQHQFRISNSKLQKVVKGLGNLLVRK